MNKINIKNELEKKRQFIEDGIGFSRKFVYIKYENEQFYIGHIIEKKIGKLIQIKFEDLDFFIKYFDRI